MSPPSLWTRLWTSLFFATTLAALLLLAGCGKGPPTAASPAPAERSPAKAGARDTASEAKPTPSAKDLPAREFLRNWAKGSFRDLHSYGEGFSRFTLEERRSTAKSPITPQQREQAAGELRRFLTMLMAPDFETFHTALREGRRTPYSLSRSGEIYTQTMLVNGNPLGDLELPKGAPQLEAYWILATRMGFPSRSFTGISESESYFTFSTQSKLTPPPYDPFPDDRGAGYDGGASMFAYDQLAPSDETQAGRRLLVLDSRLLLKTHDADIAYPVALRFWWSTREAAWIPWFVVEYNTASKRPGIIF